MVSSAMTKGLGLGISTCRPIRYSWLPNGLLLPCSCVAISRHLQTHWCCRYLGNLSTFRNDRCHCPGFRAARGWDGITRSAQLWQMVLGMGMEWLRNIRVGRHVQFMVRLRRFCRLMGLAGCRQPGTARLKPILPRVSLPWRLRVRKRYLGARGGMRLTGFKLT